MTHAAHFILYVRDQARSAAFFSHVLGLEPRLDVPGMTEFELARGGVLGLMPEAGILKLLPDLPDPGQASGVPRCELYLLVEDPEEMHARALEAGGTEMSGMQLRSWGHHVAYSIDRDGHVIAAARAATARALPTPR